MQVEPDNIITRKPVKRIISAWCFALAVLIGFLQSNSPASAISYYQYKNHRTVIKVKPGVLVETSPEIDRQSLTARRKTKTNINNKVTAIFRFFRREKDLVIKLKTIAKKYRIDPLHMLGAIAGEHAFNVDVYDKVQHYAMKSISFAGNKFVSFSCRKCRMSLTEFLKLEPLKTCQPKQGSHRYWSCVETIWMSTYFNKKVEGRTFPRLRFNEAFFNPYALGQTYGLGQLSPLSALKATDATHKIGGLKKLNSDNPAEVYAHILDTEKNLHYIAATIRNAISVYRKKANFDISQNAGIIATLYNLGRVHSRAEALYKTNLTRLRAGEELKYPRENYYGWFVNSRQADLQKLLDNAK